VRTGKIKRRRLKFSAQSGNVIPGKNLVCLDRRATGQRCQYFFFFFSCKEGVRILIAKLIGNIG